MKMYSWFLAAAIAVSVLCTIIVNPTGEGFVRGYNVVFTFLITSAIVWLMTLAPLCPIAWRCIKTKTFASALKQDRRTALLVISGLLTPLLNAMIIRIKSALEYR